MNADLWGTMPRRDPGASQVMREGHAPEHLRDAFRWYIEEENGPDSDVETDTVAVRYERQPVRVKWLIEQMWDCTDHLPWVDADILGIPRGSNFGDAAKRLLHGPQNPS